MGEVHLGRASSDAGAAALEEALPLEAPEEGAGPEERPAPASARVEELIDQLDVEPVADLIFGSGAAAAASGRGDIYYYRGWTWHGYL